MDKLDRKNDGATMDIVGQNIEKLRELFPGVFTEGKVDFDSLRDTLAVLSNRNAPAASIVDNVIHQLINSR